MGTLDIRIEALGLEEHDDVVDTLYAAFHDYPVMRYVCKDGGDDYPAHVRALIDYFTACRTLRGWPVLGAYRGEQMLGAANVNPPQSAPKPPELEARFESLRTVIGDPGIRRFNAFADACEPLEPKEPHYYLGMLGVLPDAQGLGVGGLLLREVLRMSRDDPGSSGVVLTTETPQNLPFYKHFGFELLGRTAAEDLDTWTLYHRTRGVRS